jgi:hypothetical protein
MVDNHVTKADIGIFSGKESLYCLQAEEKHSQALLSLVGFLVLQVSQ